MEFTELEGKPFKGIELDRLKAFLGQMELEYDKGIEYSLCLLDEDDEIVATGSVEQNVLKCMAVKENMQGQGLAATVLSKLIQFAVLKGNTHLLIYTKPKNQELFEDLGFYTIRMTQDILLMENKKRGFLNFLHRLKEETPTEALQSGKVIGSIVVHCNPFTYGHQYLIQQALTYCDYIHVLVLGDKRSFFSPEERLFMVQEGTRKNPEVIVHQASDFVISAATFPTYFMKDKGKAERANCRLDLELFGSGIAPALGITKRFVGTEPVCAVTGQYNEEMKKVLPAFGIEVIEIDRMCTNGEVISASTVRRLYERDEFTRIKRMVNQTTFDYLLNRKRSETKG